jgi:preprotein translocase subunit YajC
MFNSLAHAAGGAPAGQNPIAGFLPLILIFVIFYFLMIRPQQKKQKAHQAMLNSLTVGDEVITGGGIYGKIDKIVDTNTLYLEIANGVKIKVAKSAIASKVDTLGQVEAKEKK